MSIKKFIKENTNHYFFSICISVFNTWQYAYRTRGQYKYFREYFDTWQYKTKEKIDLEQDSRLSEFLLHVIKKSPFYSTNQLLPNCTGNHLSDFKVLDKQSLRENLKSIVTVNEIDGIVSYTGGTTGTSLKVIYAKEDLQERFASLDNFRAHYGYELGKKTAWFSGKDLINKTDIIKRRFYKDDYFNKIRFFSTFHVSESTWRDYWIALEKFKPEYIVGFPSTIYEIAYFASRENLKFNNIKAIFPTAEKLIDEQVELIQSVFGSPVIDQYASSEGAPFIFQCEKGSKHIDPLTGVFEVVDENLTPCQSGQLLVTSFSTRGTPLVRYQIGDGITLSDEKCTCGRNTQVVKSIDGRVNDYIYSKETGKINLGNISNITKGINGINRFQLIQNQLDNLLLLIEGDISFNDSEKEKLIDALKERVGSKINIECKTVVKIEVEKSGKFSIVKNNIKHLIGSSSV
jgi:phenylacetate-CoA ligase